MKKEHTFEVSFTSSNIHDFFLKNMKKSYFLLSALLGGGAFGLYGCEKTSESDFSPKKTDQPSDVLLLSGKKSGKSEGAWAAFVEKVERGELKDALGQYVSDGTMVKDDQKGARLQRPKFDAALANYPAWYGVQIEKQLGVSKQTFLKEGDVSDEPYGVNLDEDPIPLPDPGYPDPSDPNDPTAPPYYPTPTPPVTGPSIVYGNFESSEQRLPVTSYAGNSNGYIMDLKVGKDNLFGGGTSIPDSYTEFTINLNKGAGGSRVWIGFTRNPADVASNKEGQRSLPLVDCMATGRRNWYDIIVLPSFNYYPSGPSGWADIWNANDNPNNNGSWDTLDLNAGAGGWYINSFQLKGSVTGSLPAPYLSVYAIEVGILYGNSASIQPPAGWTKVGCDLNLGAGGDYIYLCTKRRT